MKRVILTTSLVLFFAVPVFAGGGFGPEQMAVPQSKVVVVAPATQEKESSWVVPVVASALGALGVIGAALITKKRG